MGSWSVNWRKINFFFYHYVSFVKSEQTALQKQEKKPYANTKTGSLTNHCCNTIIYGVKKNYLVRCFVHLKRKLLGNHEPHYAAIKKQFVLFRLNAGLSIIHLVYCSCAMKSWILEILIKYNSDWWKMKALLSVNQVYVFSFRLWIFFYLHENVVCKKNSKNILTNAERMLLFLTLIKSF